MGLDPNMGAAGKLGLRPLLSQKAISRGAVDVQDGQVSLSAYGPARDFAVSAATARGLVGSPPNAPGRFPGVKLP